MHCKQSINNCGNYSSYHVSLLDSVHRLVTLITFISVINWNRGLATEFFDTCWQLHITSTTYIERYRYIFRIIPPITLQISVISFFLFFPFVQFYVTHLQWFHVKVHLRLCENEILIHLSGKFQRHNLNHKIPKSSKLLKKLSAFTLCCCLEWNNGFHCYWWLVLPEGWREERITFSCWDAWKPWICYNM